jgi:4-carboxymuconolactone decarboxylase
MASRLAQRRADRRDRQWRSDDPAWSGHDALLMRVADDLHDTCGVSDALWSALAERFSDEQLLEIVIAAGW